MAVKEAHSLQQPLSMLLGVHVPRGKVQVGGVYSLKRWDTPRLTVIWWLGSKQPGTKSEGGCLACTKLVLTAHKKTKF